MNTFVIAILLSILARRIWSLPVVGEGNRRTAVNRNSSETVSQRKCKKFSEIRDPEYATHISHNNENGPPICLIQYWNSYLGREAAPYEFPHLALLGYESYGKPDNIKWRCTGNLISDQYVVTEAHCLDLPPLSRNLPPTYVRLGVSGVNDSPYRQDFNVEKIIIHPDYSNKSYYNDIGLVKLDKRAKLNSKVKPICLPSEPVAENRDIISTGFDLRSVNRGVTETVKVVKHNIRTLHADACNNHVAYKGNRGFTKGDLDNSQLCVGLPKEDDQLCNDGPGWAAQTFNDKVYCTYLLIAMASFDLGCITRKDPGVSTNILPFVEWIENVVWANEKVYPR